LPIKRATRKILKALLCNAFKIFLGLGLSAKRCNKYSQPAQSSRLLLAYSEFEKSLDFFQTIQRVSFDTNAYSQFEILRRQFRRLGTRDLRIAAIALSINATVITRNAKDFGQIPNLSIEDWTTEKSSSY
jgi:predicted nucleic acid-binding protein